MKQKKLLILSIVTLILIGVCTWYVMPTRYQLPDIEKLTLEVRDYANNTYVELTNFNQKQELYNLIGELSVRRPFFYSYGDTMPDGNFVFVYIGSKVPEQNDYYNLILLLALNENGFIGEKIYGHDFQQSLIINPQELITYIKDTFLSPERNKLNQ